MKKTTKPQKYISISYNQTIQQNTNTPQQHSHITHHPPTTQHHPPQTKTHNDFEDWKRHLRDHRLFRQNAISTGCENQLAYDDDAPSALITTSAVAALASATKRSSIDVVVQAACITNNHSAFDGGWQLCFCWFYQFFLKLHCFFFILYGKWFYELYFYFLCFCCFCWFFGTVVFLLFFFCFYIA